MGSKAGKVLIKAEYSAQAMNAPPNPMVVKAIDAVREQIPEAAYVADQGCGKLRHFHILRQEFSHLVLVDTESQLTRNIRLDGKAQTIPEYVHSLRHSSTSRGVRVISSKVFENSNLGLD